MARFNLFRKIPEDLQVATSSGFIFTFITCIIMLYLVIGEYAAYSTHRMGTRVVLDSHQEDLLRINFNVSLPAVPCRYATVDISDHMGQKFSNITRHIRRFQLASAPDKEEVYRTQEVFIADNNLASWGNIAHELHEGQVVTPSLKTKDFDDFMMKYDLVLVNYYAPWCPYSKLLMPVWEQAALQLQDHPEYSEKVIMARVDCTQDDSVELCRRARIHAFPSMMIYMYGRTFTRYIYNGPRNAESILLFLDLFYRRLEPDADFAEEVADPSNNMLLPQHIESDTISNINFKNTKTAENSVEGCELSGSISVHRVPGKLVISARSAEQSLDLTNINVSHTIHHFSFGQMKTSEQRLNSPKPVMSKHYPMDLTKYESLNQNITIEHYIKIVGIDHVEASFLQNIVDRIYEFSASSNQYNASNEYPAALFTYDVSPLVIEIFQETMPLFRFLTSLCAIVGGVYTILGLVDAGVFHAINTIQKKQRLGKLM